MSNSEDLFKEIFAIFLAIILLTFIVIFNSNSKSGINYLSILFSFFIAALVIIINILGKKIVANFYGARINHKIWMIKRYGFRREAAFNKPLPVGILIPFLVSLISYGYIMFMTFLEFDVYSTSARSAKSQGIHRFTEITEIHLGLIAAAGIFFNLIGAVIGYIANFPEFSRLNIYYSLFCLIPLSNLDGSKIFFSTGSSGNKITFGLPTLWIILLIINLIFLAYSFILI
ncbi:MAG TPA: hypothetical protein P5277_03700 [Candidatus Paceibacterota bacterium]|nr:hypothetical protein [Candidatus Paceibacterota bacterium]